MYYALRYRARALQEHADRVDAQVRQARLRARSARKANQRKIANAKQASTQRRE